MLITTDLFWQLPQNGHHMWLGLDLLLVNYGQKPLMHDCLRAGLIPNTITYILISWRQRAKCANVCNRECNDPPPPPQGVGGGRGDWGVGGWGECNMSPEIISISYTPC